MSFILFFTEKNLKIINFMKDITVHILPFMILNTESFSFILMIKKCELVFLPEPSLIHRTKSNKIRKNSYFLCKCILNVMNLITIYTYSNNNKNNNNMQVPVAARSEA
jgi:hypothetical protein